MSDFNLSYRQIGDLGNKIGGDAGAKAILSGESIVVPRKEAVHRGVILAFERNVPITPYHFVASECFTKASTRMKFGYIDEKFVKLFGKIREDVPAGELAAHTLLERKHDPEILVALGLQFRRYIKLGQFYQLIEAQGCGQ